LTAEAQGFKQYRQTGHWSGNRFQRPHRCRTRARRGGRVGHRGGVHAAAQYR
jgi:hypothetical protein